MKSVEFISNMFSWFCHQELSRSVFTASAPLLCARCSGIYTGAMFWFVGVLSFPNKQKFVQKYPYIVFLIILAALTPIEFLLEGIGLENKRPIITFVSPEDGATHMDINTPQVAVTVIDPEGDKFNISIHGKYLDNITQFNQGDKTFIAKLKTPLPPLTHVGWNVNISYGQNKWINNTYRFTTW